MKKIFLTLLLLSSIAHAVEIRVDNIADPRNILETKDQYNSGLCYSFAASYLLDHKRLREKQTPLFKSSPVAIAINYKKKRFYRSRNLSGGTICQAIKAASPLLPESSEHGMLKFKMYHQFLEKSQELHNAIRQDQAEKYQYIDNFFVMFFGRSYENEFTLTNTHGYKKFLAQILHITAEGIQADVKATCKTYYRFFHSKNSQLKIIKQELTAGRPVGIAYCSSVLVYTNKDAPCGSHASVVVGYRENVYGVEQYLIQNSWGTDCSKYRWECHQGKIWIDKDEFKQALQHVAVVH